MLRNPKKSMEIIDRKYESIFKGYNELDFSFPEIKETFNDINITIHHQLVEIEEKLCILNQPDNSNDDLVKTHKKYYIDALNFIKKNSIIQRIISLSKGIIVERITPLEKDVELAIVKYPYGKCIQLCADYAEFCDLLYRVLQRFEKFGPASSYFDEAISLRGMPKVENFQIYLTILEKQDYITAFHHVASTCDPFSTQYRNLLLAKENNYQFFGRTESLKEIYKEMKIPFLFQTERYKHHVTEDLLWLDIVLFPTMKTISIKDFSKFRPFNFYPLGIVKDIIFADEFNLTSADFFYHDVKHAIDMISRNWISYIENDWTATEAVAHFIKVRHSLNQEIEKYVDNLHLDNNKHDDLMRAINLTLFEMYHEEGYPYSSGDMIRSLINPNPFYGKFLHNFLKEKLTLINFFSPKNTSLKELDFPYILIDQARSVILNCLQQINGDGKDLHPYSNNVDHWEITRGKTQRNIYQKVDGEKDYKIADKKIGNIFLLFKEKIKTNKQENYQGNNISKIKDNLSI